MAEIDYNRSPNTKKMVSIILPVYNAEGTIQRTIQSIVAQSYRDWEIIIVDDGSDDLTSAIIRKYSSHEGISILSHPKNQGFVSALRTGISAANGEYLARIDADDTWHANHLEVMMQLAKNQPDAGLLASRAFNCTSPNGRRHEISLSPMIDDHKIQEMLVFDNPIVHSSVVIKSSVYEFSDGYQNSPYRWEDYHLWIRMLRTQRFAFSGTPTVDYYILPNSLSREKKVLALTHRFKLQLLAYTSLPRSRSIRSTTFLLLSAIRLVFLQATTGLLRR